MKSASVLLLFAAACAPVPPAGVHVTGEWGGPHIGLTLGPAGGQLEYDCAAGTIGSITPANDGTFSAEGTHTPGFGGPEVEGQTRPTYATLFEGRVRGDRMTLTGRVENGVVLGPFALTRGAEPGIFRCL